MARFRGKYAYLGAWNYILLDILYAIPVVGLVFLVLHATNSNNENRQHYARSYFARFLLILVLCAIGAGVFYLVAGSEAFMTKFNEITKLVTDYVKTLIPAKAA